MLSRSISGSLVGVPEKEDEDEEGGGVGDGGARKRAGSRASGGALDGLREEGDDDRIDAKNAASRLAASTF